jgi:hypothetical protein
MILATLTQPCAQLTFFLMNFGLVLTWLRDEPLILPLVVLLAAAVAGRVMRPSDAVSSISDGAVGAARFDQGWTLDEVAGDPSARNAAEAAFLRHCEEEGRVQRGPPHPQHPLERQTLRPTP